MSPTEINELLFGKEAFTAVFDSAKIIFFERERDIDHFDRVEWGIKLLQVDFTVPGTFVQMVKHRVKFEMLPQKNDQIIEFLSQQSILIIDLNHFNHFVGIFENTDIFEQEIIFALFSQNIHEALDRNVA